MSCIRCQSEDSTDFPAQVQIHLDVSRKAAPVVLRSPVAVCFSCGYAGFAVSDEELQVLKQARGN